MLSAWLARRGCVTLAVEGGQHDDASTIAHLEAVITIALAAAGNVERARLPGFESAREHLTRARGDLPRVMEVLGRHAIRADDRFVMEPGFSNLARVRRGTLLARDARGEIRAAHDGVLMLPLYQSQGDDGFFWGREVSRPELRLSHALRRAGVDRALTVLPGIRDDGGQLVMSARAARTYPRALLRMLGVRRLQDA